MRVRTVLLVFLLSIPCILAIGVRPPIVGIQYQAGQTVEFPIQILNLNDFPIELETRTASIGTISLKVPRSIPAQGTGEVIVTLTLPQTIEPGMNSGYIFFKEKYVDETTATFPVRTEVGVRLDIWEPYPGQYARITVNAQSVEEGKDTVLGLVVDNLGEEAITDATATVRVLNAGGSLQDVFTFPDINVAGDSNDKFTAVIRSSGYSPGKYLLAASMPYGERVATMNSTFIVGTQDVDILGIEGPFYLDKPVNKFAVRVENLWNKPVDNVYAQLRLGETVSPTSSMSVSAFGIETLSGFWETVANTPTGEVLVNVTVYFPSEDGGTGSRSKLVPLTIYNQTPVQVVEEEPGTVLPPLHLAFAIVAILIVLRLVLIAVRMLGKKSTTDAPDSQEVTTPKDGKIPPP